MSERQLVAGQVRLIPDPRTNSILVVTRPSNFNFIKGLIQEFDRPIELSKPFEHSLQYVSAAEVVPVLVDVLSENQEAGSGRGAGGQAVGGGTAPAAPSRLGGGSSRSGSSIGGREDRLQAPAQDTAPTSVIVGKTRIIANNKANSILILGPSESIEKAKELIERLDRRPMQVYLSTVHRPIALGGTITNSGSTISSASRPSMRERAASLVASPAV